MEHLNAAANPAGGDEVRFKGVGMGNLIANVETRFSSRHIKSLDGLRGLAFLLIFFHHYALTTHATQMCVKVVAYLSDGGWVGVDLFFVLSGFLITGILLDTRGLPRYFTNFYARRTLRIFPLYYTVLGVLFVLTPWLHLQWHLGHLAYVFYAGNIAYGLRPSLATVQPAVSFLHLWSLAVEEQFYLLWPLVVLAAARGGRLARVCYGLSLGALVLRVCLLLWLPRIEAYEWCYAELPTHMDGLLYGGLAALWVRTLPMEQVLRRARRVLPWAIGVLALVVVAGGIDFHSVAMTLAGYPALAAAFACVVLLALKPGSPVNRFGNLTPLRFIGRYSYGMYVYHLLFWPGLAWIQGWLQLRLHSVVLGGVCFVLLMLGGTMVMAIASYELYEKQWLRLKSRFAYEKTQPEVAA
jgi:peptidoglycan/LPS O-acetylase OafA/YrhL